MEDTTATPLGLLIAGCFLGFAGPVLFASPAMAAQTINCTVSGQLTHCIINEPAVTQRLTSYPGIVFKGGDLVTISAGGCVQTGGHGSTWKRYVNPSGSDSDRLYHGLIQIPGVQSDLVRILGAINHPLRVPANFNDPTMFLRLGYEDDGYGDNGYYAHDDGTEDQCKGVGSAFVVLNIQHGAATSPAASAPFDLVSNDFDPNGFPFNPQWAWQRDHPKSLPDANTMCFNKPGIFSNTACTTQSPSLDVPEGWNGFWCSRASEHSINGHVNWMPATWQGQVYWDSKSDAGADDDYNINIEPPGQEGLTVSSAGRIHTEFDSDETIDHFTTPWWDRFHSTVDIGDDSPMGPTSTMINRRTAIEIGLAGLDCEHGCATELHPVFGFAIDADGSNYSDDTWAMFVRNFGDEGYCSQDEHFLDTNRIAFMVPLPTSLAIDVKAVSGTNFKTNSNSAAGPRVTFAPGKGALVEFFLPDPEQRGFIEGELHLNWTFSGVIPPSNRRQPPHIIMPHGPTAGEAKPEVEEQLAQVLTKLPTDVRTALVKSLAAARGGPLMATRPALQASAPSVFKVARVRAVHDPAKAAKDQQRAEKICAAFNNDVPGAPGQCLRFRRLPSIRPMPPMVILPRSS